MSELSNKSAATKIRAQAGLSEWLKVLHTLGHCRAFQGDSVIEQRAIVLPHTET